MESSGKTRQVLDYAYKTGQAVNLSKQAVKEVDSDLYRLERLEAAFKIICEELDISLAETEGDYTIIANWCSSGVSKRKGKLLKEVLNYGK